MRFQNPLAMWHLAAVCFVAFTSGQFAAFCGAVAQPILCPAGQGAYEIEVRHDGDINNFNIAVTNNLGSNADAPEDYILNLKPFEVRQTVVRRGCFESHTLHRFVVYERQTPRSSTTYSLAVNGRKIELRPRRQTLEEYYFVGDRQSCAANEGRFQFEIRFDNWPEEVKWSLKSRLPILDIFDFLSPPVTVMTYLDTLKAGTSLYSPDFNSDTLVVDNCIEGGYYEFQLRDTDNKLADRAYWKILINNVVIEINGDERQYGGPQLTIPFTYSSKSGTFVAPTPAPSEADAPVHCMPGVPPSIDTKTPSPFNSGTPVSYPDLPPNVAPPVACFSGGMLVLVQNVGPVEMHNLKIGDRIAVGRGRYEPVYSFGHYEPQAFGPASDFLEIGTQSGAALRVSRNHLIFVVRAPLSKATNPFLVAVPASLIQVGDELASERLCGNHGDTNCRVLQNVVTSIQSVRVADGLYAPFTASGQFLVVSSHESREEGSILVSSFIGFGESHEITIGGGFSVSFQWLAHSFEFPHRMRCRFFWKQCKEEIYDARGLSTWVAKPFDHVSWLVQLQDGVLKTCCLMLATGTLLFFWVLQNFPFSVFMLVTMILALWTKRALRFHLSLMKMRS